MRRYHGRRRAGLRIVWVERDDGRLAWLGPRRDLWDHSATFDWGPIGDADAATQLALALCADALGDARAVGCYLAFAREEVALLADSWDMTDAWLRGWRDAAGP